MRLTSWYESGSLSWLALLGVILVQLMLCIEYHENRWDTVVAVRGAAPEHAGEGLVIRGNGLGYYAWLRSLLIDHDWSFDNEFDEHNPDGYYLPPPSYRTPLDRRANQWSVGPACIWAVMVVPGHFLLQALDGWVGPWAADGYSFPYQLLVGATSLLVEFLGLVLLYRICRTTARPARAAAAASLLTLGTTIVYYNAIEPTYAHGLGTAMLAALVWYWLATYGSVRPGRWFLVGILVGLSALMRWQLATYGILFVGEALLASRQRGRLALALAALAGAGAFLAILPQLIAWRCVYGSWLAGPPPGVTYHWMNPPVWTILFSWDRSLFYWTPVTLVAFTGTLTCLARRNLSADPQGGSPGGFSKQPLWILCIAFLIQLYALAGMWGEGEHIAAIGHAGGVYLGRSFGFRDLTESLVILAPGLAWLLDRAGPRRYALLLGSGFLLVVWNLLLVRLYTDGILPKDAGADPITLLSQAGTLIREDPFTIMEIMLGPLLIMVVLLFADRNATGTSPAPAKA